MELTIHKRLDIKGEVCPYTFVKSKLALMPLAAGQVLEIILDYPDAAENVPRSMADEGHEVLAVEKINDSDWRVVVRKCRP